MKKGLKAILASGAIALPFIAFAQNIADIIVQVEGIINAIIPFIIGLAVLVIIWGVFGYITGAGDEEKRGEAKQYIIWGIIGVFVMLSIWGLVNVVVSSFALNPNRPPSPQVGAGTVLQGGLTAAQKAAIANCQAQGKTPVIGAGGTVTCP